MLYDQLHIDIDRDECERTNFIKNGYFYILQYNANNKKSFKPGFDKIPLIYCLAPDTTDINCFWGVNFHYFPKNIQELILQNMINNYNITDGKDKRVILSPKQLYDIYTNISVGLRCYNRKGVLDAYRIYNCYIPKYLDVSPEFIILNKEKIITDFSVSNGNKGF